MVLTCHHGDNTYLVRKQLVTQSSSRCSAHAATFCAAAGTHTIRMEPEAKFLGPCCGAEVGISCDHCCFVLRVVLAGGEEGGSSVVHHHQQLCSVSGSPCLRKSAQAHERDGYCLKPLPPLCSPSINESIIMAHFRKKWGGGNWHQRGQNVTLALPQERCYILFGFRGQYD